MSGAFTGLDYAVLFLYLLLTAWLGSRLGRGQKDLNDYFLAGRHLPWWAICFSIVATETSTLTFIGIPAIAYLGDMTFLQVALGYVVGRLLVSFLLIPAYFRGQIQTAYEVLRQRFGGSVQYFSAGLFQLTRALSDGVRLFATGLVLSEITGLGVIWTVLLIGAVTIVYTLLGGMRAVVWNDVLQLFVYLLGALLAFGLILEKIPGGWQGVAASAAAQGKFRIFDFGFDLARNYTFWGGLLGGAFLTFATHGTDQMMVQRYLASGSRRASQRALILSGLVVLLQFALFLLIGVMLFAFYQHFPLTTPLEQVDRVFPRFIVEEIPAGVSGLIIAAIFAAAMSTLSSSLNSLASSSVNDFYRSWRGEQEGGRELLLSRLLTLLWGVALMGTGLLARNWPSVLEAGLTIASVTMGALLGIFLIGLWTPLRSPGLAAVAMGTGLLSVLWLHWRGGVSWTWYVLVGTALTLAVGWFFSQLERRPEETASAPADFE